MDLIGWDMVDCIAVCKYNGLYLAVRDVYEMVQFNRVCAAMQGVF